MERGSGEETNPVAAGARRAAQAAKRFAAPVRAVEKPLVPLTRNASWSCARVGAPGRLRHRPYRTTARLSRNGILSDVEPVGGQARWSILCMYWTSPCTFSSQRV